jgi:hypothetical protein
MGTMTFLLPAELSAEQARELERACIAGGPDNMPWPTRAQVEHSRLSVRREVDESGYLVVPWTVEGAGLLTGTTATLMERAQPYHLQAELARGKVHQVRGQAADWYAGGLPVAPELEARIRQASSSFGKAILDPQPDQASHHAQAALVQAYRAAEQLTQTYIDQVFLVRHQREPQLGTGLGCRLESPLHEDSAGLLLQTCNSVCIPFPWSTIEASEGSYQWQTQDALLDWAEDIGLPVTGGPLIDFSSVQMPDWLWLWERDLQSLFKFMSNYLTATLRRYRRRIRRWQLTAASNSAAVLSLGEEELLWLTVKLTQVARQLDPALELIVGVAQPWGEYMAHEDRSHSPFIFADTLIRSDLNLAALDVELIMGVTPRGSYCRDLLDTSRMLDLYALLGVPLRITLAYPSAGGSDSRADPEQRVAAGHWRDGFSEETQAAWARSYGALALCKPYVQALHWAQLSDAGAHPLPHCGVLDAEDNPKPVLEELRLLRQQHLR